MVDDIKRYAIDNHIPIMRDDTIKALIEALTAHNPKNILEIGTAIGYSGSIVLNSCKDALLTTIEIDDDRAEMARDNFNRLGLYHRVNLMKGDADEILGFIEEKYDFILLDGPKAHYYEMLPRIIELLTDNGVIFADNVLFHGLVEKRGNIDKKYRTIVNNMRKFIDSVDNNKSLMTSLLRIDDGVMIIRKI